MVFRKIDSGIKPILVYVEGKLVHVLGKPVSVKGKLNT